MSKKLKGKNSGEKAEKIAKDRLKVWGIGYAKVE